jgi:hypothetical protein
MEIKEIIIEITEIIEITVILVFFVNSHRFNDLPWATPPDNGPLVRLRSPDPVHPVHPVPIFSIETSGTIETFVNFCFNRKMAAHPFSNLT